MFSVARIERGASRSKVSSLFQNLMQPLSAELRPQWWMWLPLMRMSSQP
jgi:hypothetical protein